MKRQFRVLSLLFLCIILSNRLPLQAQPLTVSPTPLTDQPGINKGRFIGVVAGTAVFYTVTLLMLKKQWYKKRIPFHSFNDNREWLQMDKVGHATTAYCMSRGGYELMR